MNALLVVVQDCLYFIFFCSSTTSHISIYPFLTRRFISTNPLILKGFGFPLHILGKSHWPSTPFWILLFFFSSFFFLFLLSLYLSLPALILTYGFERVSCILSRHNKNFRISFFGYLLLLNAIRL